MVLSIDLETYSSVDLRKGGVYPYAASRDFEILLFAYSVDAGPVEVVDLAQGEAIPNRIVDMLFDPAVLKTAFNAQFERTCLARHFGAEMPADQWECTAALALALGLPRHLADVGKVLKIEQQKMTAGKNLIRYFCIPCKPTRVNGGRTRNYPSHDREKWQEFKKYCARDVEAELEIREKLMAYRLNDTERAVWALDQRINDRGAKIDRGLVIQAIKCDEGYRSVRLGEAEKILNGGNPQSVAQIKKWLEAAGMDAVESLGKPCIPDLIQRSPSPQARRLLELRQELSKSSIKKYSAMLLAALSDDRVRGLFQYHGARTGRWAGRIVQAHNLPRNTLTENQLATARQAVSAGRLDLLEALYDDVPALLSELIRTAFIPEPGHRFLVADFSAIEARLTAWLAGEVWRLDIFKTHGKIYEASAAAMFGVPIETVTKGSELRQKGKVAELACIAEGSLVLTDRGLVPIERVLLSDRVWDGEDFVAHDGVVCRGVKEVICYAGLTATADHPVFVAGERRPVHFGEAATRALWLITTGFGDQPILKAAGERIADMFAPQKSAAKVYDILNAGSRHRFTVSDCLVHNCGYGGSVGALKKMGAGDLSEAELKDIINRWRKASPNIVKLWHDLESCAFEAVQHGSAKLGKYGVEFIYEKGVLFMVLPSGRRLAYIRPKVVPGDYGDQLIFQGLDVGKWGIVKTYGGRLVENCIQAIARDCLSDALLRLDRAGYKVVMHVHDEIVCEMPEDAGSLEEMIAIMCEPPAWGPDIPLEAHGFESKFYYKD